MNYGLYLSASGVLTSMYRQDVFANNLANVQSVGYKPDVPVLRQRSAEALTGGYPQEFRNALLDRMGGGVLNGKQTVSLKAGPIHQTGNPLDAALQDENAFFAVRSYDGRTGQQGVRLTRDGRFATDAQGRLVTAADGKPVLDKDDKEIQLQSNMPASINRFGQVVQGGAVVAQVQITAVSDPQRLVKAGQNLLWSADGSDMRSAVPEATLVPQSTEASGADPIKALMNLVDATKAVTLNGNMIRYHDQIMDRAVNTLGRVS